MHAENPPASEHAWQRAVIGADAYYGMVLAATIVTMVATPFLFEASHSIADRVARRGGAAPGREAAPSASGGPPTEGHVLILGFGHTGETLARVLTRASVPFVIAT